MEEGGGEGGKVEKESSSKSHVQATYRKRRRKKGGRSRDSELSKRGPSRSKEREKKEQYFCFSRGVEEGNVPTPIL